MVDGWFGDGDWSDSGNPLDNNIWDSPEPEEDRQDIVEVWGTPAESNADAVQLWLLLYGQTLAAPPDIRIPAAFGPGEDAGDCGGNTDAQDNDTQDGFADFVRDVINGIPSSGSQEWGAALSVDALGRPYSPSGGVSTIGEVDENTLYIPPNPSEVYGIIHNHPDALGGQDTDRVNRYPSPADWEAAEQMVAAGADGNNFSLYIIDADGEMREFSYADRERYENLSETEMERGEDLPEPIIDDDAERADSSTDCTQN